MSKLHKTLQLSNGRCPALCKAITQGHSKTGQLTFLSSFEAEDPWPLLFSPFPRPLGYKSRLRRQDSIGGGRKGGGENVKRKEACWEEKNRNVPKKVVKYDFLETSVSETSATTTFFILPFFLCTFFYLFAVRLRPKGDRPKES